MRSDSNSSDTASPRPGRADSSGTPLQRQAIAGASAPAGAVAPPSPAAPSAPAPSHVPAGAPASPAGSNQSPRSGVQQKEPQLVRGGSRGNMRGRGGPPRGQLRPDASGNCRPNAAQPKRGRGLPLRGGPGRGRGVPRGRGAFAATAASQSTSSLPNQRGGGGTRGRGHSELSKSTT
jgi:hypothetical protein